MLLLVFGVALSILLGGTDAVQENEIPTMSEIQRIQESSNCGDTLLSKLVHELDDMRGQIMYEIPKQLAKEAEVTKKIVYDLAQVKDIVEKQSVDIEVIKKSVNSESYQHDLSKLEASVDALTNGNRLISESLLSHDERLTVHDQRLQNITTKDSRSSICVDARHWFQGKPAVWTSGQTEDPSRCGTPYMWKTKNGVQTPFQYTNWIPGYPDCNNNDENCVNLVGAYTYLWNDAPCSDVYCVLCEFPINS